SASRAGEKNDRLGRFQIRKRQRASKMSDPLLAGLRSEPADCPRALPGEPAMCPRGLRGARSFPPLGEVANKRTRIRAFFFCFSEKNFPPPLALMTKT
ncbi:MAG: hypothetical protein II889_05520, partial [Clostridia bacterium]|nr:hypothetical protein [Clostridia bacterium]